VQPLADEDAHGLPVAVGETGVDHRLPALLPGEHVERRLLDRTTQLRPGTEAVLAGEHELRVGEQEPVGAGAGCSGTRERGGVAGAMGADELLRLAPVVLEARPFRKVTHDESPFDRARRPRPRAKEVSSAFGAVLVGVRTSLPADRRRPRGARRT
jgi:hypothetical protein